MSGTHPFTNSLHRDTLSSAAAKPTSRSRLKICAALAAFFSYTAKQRVDVLLRVELVRLVPRAFIPGSGSR
jgi:autonomous glycyl radical cofactor GrcA